MSRYFRCGDPTGQCELSRTKQIVTDCPCNNPSCEAFRSEVSFFEAHAGKIKLAGAGVGLLVVALLALQLLKGDPLQSEVNKLFNEASTLNARLVSLEAKPKAATGGVANSTLALRQLLVRSKESESRIRRALAAEEFEIASKELDVLENFSRQADELRDTPTKPEAGSGEILIESRHLVDEYKDLASRVEALLARVHVVGNGRLADKCDSLRGDVDAELTRAVKLAKPADVRKPDDIELATITKEIKSLAPNLKQLLTKVVEEKKARDLANAVIPAPFDPKDATLKISATTELAEKLVKPLLQSKSGGVTIFSKTREQQNGSWFYTSKEGSQPKEKVLIVENNSSSLEDLFNGLADLCIIDRMPSQEESAKFRTAFPGESLESRAHAEVLAMDAMTFVAHPESAISLITPEMLGSQEWIVGAPGSAENMIARRFGVHVAKELNRLEERCADAVLQRPGLLGIGVFHNEGSNIRAKRLPYQVDVKAKELKPSPFTIATEDYKFAFRILAITSPRSRVGAIDLVRFATSEKGQVVVAEQQFVDLRLRPSGGDADPLILAALGEALGVKSIKGALRLSTNFHFATGDDKLDLKALADVERLPVQVAREYHNSKTVIIGFADETGGAHINLPLSRKRAETVALELRKSGMDVKTAGMGDQLPIDSNATEEGRARNRRSEVWVVTQ